MSARVSLPRHCGRHAGAGGHHRLRQPRGARGLVSARSRSKASARARFNLPAGKPEVGETLIEAAVREAKEESGLDVAIDHIVGLYHCPQTSEGFGVLNVVFASTVTGGEIVISDAHPEVRYFTRAEVADLSTRRLLRGSHIELAMDAHAAGQSLPLDLLRVVPGSRLPA